MPRTRRRRFLTTSLAAGGAALLGRSAFPAERGGEPPPAEQVDVLPFLGEGKSPLDTLLGSGLDGRLYTDLATLDPEAPLTPNERFYVRTRCPDRLADAGTWTITIRGLVREPHEVTRAALAELVAPAGTHVMECAGNNALTRFGLMSAARWSGASLSRLLEGVDRRPGATRVLVSGFDTHSAPSSTSTSGASWIFTLDEIRRDGAFLATEMNGAPLSPDHGFPARLIVPGWYGCACIKWVHELVFVDEDEPATTQMKEFAARTHQDGVPERARDYRPATMDLAAMPVRVERWRTDGSVHYRIVGILWGGEKPVESLVIRFNDAEEKVRIPPWSRREGRTWTVWTHPWRPTVRGRYRIAPGVPDPTLSGRRLASGYYSRTVWVDEV